MLLMAAHTAGRIAFWLLARATRAAERLRAVASIVKRNSDKQEGSPRVGVEMGMDEEHAIPPRARVVVKL